MTLLKALLCQVIAGVMVFTAGPWLTEIHLKGGYWLLLQGALAASLSAFIRQPIWWLPIQLLFLPAAWLLLTLHLPAWLYLSAFILLLLAFWGTARGDVPLFLSSDAVTYALMEIIEHERATSLIELGAGIGSVVVPLARSQPSLQITAVEQAPLPWLILRWRCRGLGNVKVLRKSFWDSNLGEHSIAFAFLSPLVMHRIGEKCHKEMTDDKLCVSSSFVIPDLTPETVMQLEDRRKTRLYCYRFPTQKRNDKLAPSLKKSSQ